MANIPHKYLFPFEILLLILVANFRLPQLQNFWQMELYGCKLHRLLYHFLHPLFQRNSSLIQRFPTYIYNFPIFALNSLHYKIYYLCKLLIYNPFYSPNYLLSNLVQKILYMLCMFHTSPLLMKFQIKSALIKVPALHLSF